MIFLFAYGAYLVTVVAVLVARLRVRPRESL